MNDFRRGGHFRHFLYWANDENAPISLSLCCGSLKAESFVLLPLLYQWEMAVHLLTPFSSLPRIPSRNPNPSPKSPLRFRPNCGFRCCCSSSRREAVSVASVTLALTLANALSVNAQTLGESPPPPPQQKKSLDGICSTKSWFQFSGDGFSIRVPPQFEDIMEPEV